MLKINDTRAVLIQNPEWMETTRRIRQGLKIGDNRELAALYTDDPTKKRGFKITGENEYFKPFTSGEIFAEAKDGGVHIDEDALALLTAHLNNLRESFEEICAQYCNNNLRIAGRLLFAPIGARGRSPSMHVDNVPLTLHSTFAGGRLNIHTGTSLDDIIWDMMNRKKTPNKLVLRQITNDSREQFIDAAFGDAVVMRGQKNLNLDDKNIRNRVCVHTSSRDICDLGQAAVTFTQKPLDFAGIEL